MSSVGHIDTKHLVNGTGSAIDVFRYQTELSGRLPEVNQTVVTALDSPQALKYVEQEYEFVQDNRISCPTVAGEGYPSRLREYDDTPVVLFLKGKADLSAFYIINMVRTRSATDYRKQICVSLLQDLQALYPGVLVVNGLAYGTGINTRRATLTVELPTVGVLAHGLGRIYSSLHRKATINMFRRGGLLAGFLSGTNPDKYNFASQNRIVTGISDVIIVVGSAVKGGPLITADIAGSYHHDCFIFPGRVTDEYSKGCSRLIRDNKAVSLESMADFVKVIGWDTGSYTIKPTTMQRDLFPGLSTEELRIVDILGWLGDLQVNASVVQADAPINKINVILFELGMKEVIWVLVGRIYRLLK